jgi:hypothetical protein
MENNTPGLSEAVEQERREAFERLIDRIGALREWKCLLR